MQSKKEKEKKMRKKEKGKRVGIRKNEGYDKDGLGES